jgi:hypothetical protein
LSLCANILAFATQRASSGVARVHPVDVLTHCCFAGVAIVASCTSSLAPCGSTTAFHRQVGGSALLPVFGVVQPLFFLLALRSSPFCTYSSCVLHIHPAHCRCKTNTTRPSRTHPAQW